MKKYAIIVAGGNGQRMGTSIPKQFLLLKNKPVIWHTVNNFLAAYSDLEVILVLPEASISQGVSIIADLSDKHRVIITSGGNTRFESVQNGLRKITDPSIVFVHDGVRCLISKNLIHRCYEQTLEKGSAIPAVTATDSVRINEERGHKSVDRNTVMIIQTPQTFLSSLLIKAFDAPYQDAFTDEATVVELSGKPVYLIDGEYSNIKITRPLDLVIAERLLEE